MVYDQGVAGWGIPPSKEGQKDRRRADVGSSWALGKVMEECNSLEKWCRGTELNCRHQPFHGITKSSKINELLQKDDAKSDISCHEKSMSYRAKCH